jgi:hypothetical protein
LFFQWHRGDTPELYRAFAVRTARYKLVQSSGVQRAAAPKYELFDISRDRGERRDIAADEPEVRDQLLSEYEHWFKDVTATTNKAPRIVVGAPNENPTVLTRQDWRGPHAGWSENSVGHWDIDVRAAGSYTVTVSHHRFPKPATLRLAIGDVAVTNKTESSSTTVRGLVLNAGACQLQCTIDQNGASRGAQFVEIRRD